MCHCCTFSSAIPHLSIDQSSCWPLSPVSHKFLPKQDSGLIENWESNHFWIWCCWNTNQYLPTPSFQSPKEERVSVLWVGGGWLWWGVWPSCSEERAVWSIPPLGVITTTTAAPLNWANNTAGGKLWRESSEKYPKTFSASDSVKKMQPLIQVLEW